MEVGRALMGRRGIISQERRSRLSSPGFLSGKHSSLLFTQVPEVGSLVSGAVLSFGRRPSWFITVGSGNCTHWVVIYWGCFYLGAGSIHQLIPTCSGTGIRLSIVKKPPTSSILFLVS